MNLAQKTADTLSEVPGMPGYLLDVHGNVYSRWVRGGGLGSGTGSRRLGEPRRITTSLSKAGYPQFGGEKNRKYVHIAMLETFVGPRPPGMWGLHQDDAKSNCRLSNLYWGSPSQNQEDRRTNFGGANEGERHGMSKLTDAQAKAIYMAKGIVRGSRLARVFGVHGNTIYRIWEHKAFTHILPHRPDGKAKTGPKAR